MSFYQASVNGQYYGTGPTWPTMWPGTPMISFPGVPLPMAFSAAGYMFFPSCFNPPQPSPVTALSTQFPNNGDCGYTTTHPGFHYHQQAPHFYGQEYRPTRWRYPSGPWMYTSYPSYSVPQPPIPPTDSQIPFEGPIVHPSRAQAVKSSPVIEISATHAENKIAETKKLVSLRATMAEISGVEPIPDISVPIPPIATLDTSPCNKSPVLLDAIAHPQPNTEHLSPAWNAATRDNEVLVGGAPRGLSVTQVGRSTDLNEVDTDLQAITVQSSKEEHKTSPGVGPATGSPGVIVIVEDKTEQVTVTEHPSGGLAPTAQTRGVTPIEVLPLPSSSLDEDVPPPLERPYEYHTQDDSFSSSSSSSSSSSFSSFSPSFPSSSSSSFSSSSSSSSSPANALGDRQLMPSLQSSSYFRELNEDPIPKKKERVELRNQVEELFLIGRRHREGPDPKSGDGISSPLNSDAEAHDALRLAASANHQPSKKLLEEWYSGPHTRQVHEDAVWYWTAFTNETASLTCDTFLSILYNSSFGSHIEGHVSREFLPPSHYTDPHALCPCMSLLWTDPKKKASPPPDLSARRKTVTIRSNWKSAQENLHRKQSLFSDPHRSPPATHESPHSCKSCGFIPPKFTSVTQSTSVPLSSQDRFTPSGCDTQPQEPVSLLTSSSSSPSACLTVDNHDDCNPLSLYALIAASRKSLSEKTIQTKPRVSLFSEATWMRNEEETSSDERKPPKELQESYDLNSLWIPKKTRYGSSGVPSHTRQSQSHSSSSFSNKSVAENKRKLVQVPDEEEPDDLFQLVKRTRFATALREGTRK